MSIKIDVKFNAKKLESFLDGLDRGLKGVSSARKAYGGFIGKIVFADVLDHFEKERGPDGKWKRWSDLYRERMVKQGKGGNRLLQDSGRLRGGFQPGRFRAQKGQVTYFNPQKTKSGFPYAAHHNDGASDGSNSRRFMWLSKDALQDVSKATLLFVMRGGL